MNDEALELIRLDRLDDPAFGHRLLSMIYRVVGMHEDAVFHARRALRLERDSTHGHGSMAITLYLAGRYAEAVPHFEQAIRANPNRGTNYIRYATSLFRSGRTDQAYRQLESFIEYTRTVASEDTSGFSKKIVEFYLGEIGEEELLNPRFSNQQDSLWKNLSASYQVGMAYLLNFGRKLRYPAPDTVRAKAFLRRALQYGAPDNAYRLMAIAELRNLGEVP